MKPKIITLTPIARRLSPESAETYTVMAYTVHQASGTGLLPATLVAAGECENANGALSEIIARGLVYLTPPEEA